MASLSEAPAWVQFGPWLKVAACGNSASEDIPSNVGLSVVRSNTEGARGLKDADFFADGVRTVAWLSSQRS
ncbi:MAG: hypothetical protein ACI8PT_004128 [Gammaproteobacteria bacterium]|jgi:hypothetical protein